MTPQRELVKRLVGRWDDDEASVLADWLEEHGFDGAADRLRMRLAALPDGASFAQAALYSLLYLMEEAPRAVPRRPEGGVDTGVVFRLGERTFADVNGLVMPIEDPLMSAPVQVELHEDCTGANPCERCRFAAAALSLAEEVDRDRSASDSFEGVASRRSPLLGMVDLERPEPNGALSFDSGDDVRLGFGLAPGQYLPTEPTPHEWNAVHSSVPPVAMTRLFRCVGCAAELVLPLDVFGDVDRHREEVVRQLGLFGVRLYCDSPRHEASCMHGDCWCRPGSDGT